MKKKETKNQIPQGKLRARDIFFPKFEVQEGTFGMKQGTREKISETMKKIGGNSGTWKKGQKVWNFKDGKRLKRKFKRFNGKNILNSHYVFCKVNNIQEIPKGHVLHHKDGDSLNDNIDNLILMKDSEHKSLHNKISAGEDLK